MKKCSQTLMWFLLLNKRLYKKAAFLIIMLLIPILVLGYSFVADDESGIITVALAKEGGDALTDRIIDDLESSDSLIRFIECETPQNAENLVIAGKADSAWIFPDDLQTHIDAFVRNGGSQRYAFVRVVERESNVALNLAREKLGGLLFDAASKTIYLDFARENSDALDALTDEELLAYYDEVNMTDTLFSYEYLSAERSETGASGYLLAPVRGLLAVVIVLSGLATAMYYMKDREVGTFSWLAEKKRPLAELGCQLISVLNISVIVTLSLALGGMTASFLRELAALILYALCTAAFSMTVRRLCGSQRVLGTLLPLLIVAMIAICPVFFDLSALRELQYLFPPTYYINAVYNGKYYLYMLLYTLAAFGVYFLTGKLFRRT